MSVVTNNSPYVIDWRSNLYKKNFLQQDPYTFFNNPAYNASPVASLIQSNGINLDTTDFNSPGELVDAYNNGDFKYGNNIQIPNYSPTSLNVDLPKADVVPIDMSNIGKESLEIYDDTMNTFVKPNTPKTTGDVNPNALNATYAGISIASNIGKSFIKKTQYDERYGNITQSIDKTGDQISQLLPAKYKALYDLTTLIGKGTNAVVGNDALNGFDAVASSDILSPLMWWTNIGNNKRTTDKIHRDEDSRAYLGTGYTGSTQYVDELYNRGGKRWSWVTRRGFKKQLAKQRDALNQEDTMLEIAAAARDGRDITQTMSPTNNTAYNIDINGGIDLRWAQVGKNGMKLDISRALNIIKKLLEGGKASDDYDYEGLMKYLNSRSPLLLLLDLTYLYDPTYQAQRDLGIGNIEYWDSDTMNDYYQKTDNNTLEMVDKYNSRVKPDAYKGHPTIIFNEHVIPEDIYLDAISHGLRYLKDPKWMELLSKLEQDHDWNLAAENEAIGWKEINDKSWKFNKLTPEQKDKFFKDLHSNTNMQHEYDNYMDGLIRAMLVKPELRELLHYGYPLETLDALSKSPVWLEMEAYVKGVPYTKPNTTTIKINNIEDVPEEFKNGGSLDRTTYVSLKEPSDIDNVELFQNGGSINVIPEGALHARKHNMENDENITKKGIPVIDNDGTQLAEIEREEIIYRLEVTEKLEELSKIFYDSESTNQLKEDAALEAGKLIAHETLHNTLDNTNNLL